MKCDKCNGDGFYLLAELGGEKQYATCECKSETQNRKLLLNRKLLVAVLAYDVLFGRPAEGSFRRHLAYDEIIKIAKELENNS